MNPLLAFVTTHWFALLLAASALVPGLFLLRGLRRGKRPVAPLLVGAALLLAGVGGLAVPPEWGLWVAVAAAGAFFVMFAVLVISGHWWPPLAGAVAAVLAVGLGSLCTPFLSEELVEAGKMLASLEAAQPWWLLLLLLVPVIVWLSFRSLAGLGPVRRWVAITLRCALIVFLALALAEVRIKHQNETTTVLFLWDVSESVPQEPYEDPSVPGKFHDHRRDRIKRFLNEAVARRGGDHKRDRAGLIVFGRRPRLELPPAAVPGFNFKEVASTIDGNYTDIAAAIKLALASFPEGSGKRIVLLSDGNENLGTAEEQARLARQNGVQIDVVPLAAGERNENEVMVVGVEAPPVAEQGTQLPIRVLLRSYNPHPVRGTLVLRQYIIDPEEPRPGEERKPEEAKPGEKKDKGTLVGKPIEVVLNPGLTSFSFRQPLNNTQKSYTYEAEFVPEGVMVDKNDPNKVEPLTGDRVQNNRARTHVVARGQRRILLVEPREGDHRNLELELRARKMDILALGVDTLPKDKDKLAVFLSNFDSVVLANLPAETLTEEQQEMIRSNTHEQGCGLVMVGGPDGFGAGGWQNTPVEKALPVDSEIKALKVQGKGGLVLIMHACEMADGNFWEKKIAKLAIDKLSSVDEVGVLYFDWGGHKWHIPLMEIDDHRSFLLSQVDKMMPGDMMDFDTPLQMAHKALTDPAKELATRHVIIISDGDPQLTNQQILPQMRKDKVTVSTVGVATHGAPQAQALADIAQKTRGRFHNVTNPNMLPAIYIKETRLVSQSFVYEKRFQPQVVFRAGPTDHLPDPPSLYGFVRTTAKASPLVEVPIESPVITEQRFPILAYWHYGLGKSVAFTSDARSNPEQRRRAWDRDWAASDMYVKFWEQVIDWSLRPTESKSLAMTTEFRDGKVKVIVDARDEQNRPLTNLSLRGGVTPPSAKGEGPGRIDLKFEQKNSGVYEAEFKADEAGSYFINAQATRKVKKKDRDGKDMVIEEGVDSVRSGVTIPYSPEYSDLESNTALLRRLAEMTGGMVYLEQPRQTVDGKPVPGEEVIPAGAPTLDEAVRADDVFRPGLPTVKNMQPVWYWLLFLTGTVLFFDVAVRRISLEAGAVVVAAVTAWERLRGHTAAAEQVPEFFDRLRSRKAQVGQAIQQGRAARRFEAEEAPAGAPPPGADALPERTEPAPRPPRPRTGAEAGEGEDYLSRLKKAKKRAMQDREGETEE
jgi:uncharacterized membrane protein